jgi:proline dehydrogenase
MRPTVRRAAWAGYHVLAKIAGRNYVAGTSVDGALQTCRQLQQQGFGSTLAYWNTEHDAPEAVAQHYIDASDALAREGLDCYLSVKATALHYSRDLLSEVATRAAAAGTRIHLDSMWPESAAQTWQLLADLAPQHHRCGCTLPGRWQRSLHDAERAIELGLAVRVVKGQWAEGTGTSSPDLSGGFLNVIDRLAGRAAFVAVATHDVHLAEPALLRLLAAGTPCALEVLFGLPTRTVVPVARALEVPIRMYVPFGTGWVPYCLSQARDNPRLLWWVLRDAALAPFHTLS